jgi:puromycin-sensitive aminopeptidase
MAARAGDAKRFDQLLQKFQAEKDPAFRRRYLMALTAFEEPQLVERAQALALTETVPMQDFAGFIGGLLGNRVGRDGMWKTLQQKWDAVLERAGGAPMLFRRVVESMGALPERRHLTEVEAFLAAHPHDATKMAAAQTLERLRQDVELRERTLAPLGAWLRAH